MNWDHKLKKSAPALLRIGISIVFMWFGTQQLIHTSQWVRLIPNFVINISHLSAVTLVHINGSFEIIFGILLLLGIWTRVVTFLLALHIMSITLDVGYSSIGARDFGLSFAVISLFLSGVSPWSIDSYLLKKKSQEVPLEKPKV